MIGLLNNWGVAWAKFFGIAVIQNTAFLGLLFLLLLLLKNRSARLRYVIGLVGLLKLLLPPFLPMGKLFTAPAATSILPVNLFDVSAISSSPSLVGAPAQGPEFGWSGLVFLVWLVLAAAYLVSVLFSTARLRWALRRATELRGVGPAWRHNRRAVRLFESEAITMPLTLGIFSGRIYVPAGWERWPENCRNIVVRHESAHISRHDGFFQVLQVLATALYFFHPMVWLLNRRLNVYREMACDDASVTGPTASRIEYSKTLVEVAETIARDAFACETASALVRRKAELANRVKYQMKEEVVRHISKTNAAVLGAALVTFTVLFSWYPGGAPRVTAASETNSAAMARTKSAETPRCIKVSIKNDENVKIGVESASLRKFQDAMARQLGTDRDDVCIDLKCASDTPMSSLFTVHRALKKLDLLKVRYMNDHGKSLPLVLPSAKIEEKMKSIPETDVAGVTIAESGTVTIDGQKVSVDKLDEILKKRLADNEHLIVSIQVDERIKYGDFVEVLGQTQKGGATRIFIKESGS